MKYILELIKESTKAKLTRGRKRTIILLYKYNKIAYIFTVTG